MAVGLHSRSRRAVIGWPIGLMVLVCAGCGLPATSTPTPEPLQVEWTGTFENGCSPVDAAGLIFDLTSPQLAGFVQISMWAGVPLDSGSSLALAGDDSYAVTAYCRASNDCQVASQGEMIILHADGQSVRGEMWMDLPQEGRIQGAFEAQWVDSGPVICG